MTDIDGLKKLAALEAVALVRSDTVIGLGTGSTAYHAIVEVGRRLTSGELTGIEAVPTSVATADLAASVGIPLIELDERRLDIAIDGADEIAPDLSLTKGGGGALLREKIVAAAADRFVVIADDSKLVDRLGTIFRIPLEVAPFGLAATAMRLSAHGRPEIRVDADGPVISDNNNRIIDLVVDPIDDPVAFNAVLATVPGVLETGIFPKMGTVAHVATASGVRELQPGG